MNGRDRNRTGWAGLASVLAGAAGCKQSHPEGGISQAAPLAGAPGVVTVASAQEFREAREPQVAIDDKGRVFIAFGAGNALYCATSLDGAKTYAPVRVGEAGKLALGMRRGPRVAVAKENVVISAIYGRSGGGRDGELVSWRSTDGGRSWSGPSPVSDVPGAAREGLHGMAAAPDGTLACAWLDLREKGTQLFAAFSRDGGKSWGKNVLIYRSPNGTICECCHPSLAYDQRGNLLVLWRNWLGGARDMYLARSTDGGRTFSAAEKLGEGRWPLNACPMDGGMIAALPDGSVATVWRRENDVYACAPGKPEVRLDRGQQPWMAATSSGPCFVWLRGRPGTVMALLPKKTTAIPLTEGGNDPVIASSPDGKGIVVAAWTAQSGIETVALLNARN